MANKSKKDRLIRVFISSTFRDMQEERDVLVKWVFPEIRRKCRERSIELVEVDLRWGITEQQAQLGETIPVCLDEIDRCRPYFIGMLGERYGWIPDNYKEDLLEVQPWIREHLNKSVTELEFLHGVFNQKDIQEQAFVYFRDQTYSQRVSVDMRPTYCSEGPSAKALLEALKNQVRKEGVFYREIYKTPQEFGEYVLQDLWKAIDKDFPTGSEPSPLEIEERKHESFAQARRSVYIGRREYFKQLDDHVHKESIPLVILGESGSGKSSLISNWIDRYRRENPDTNVFLHFVGGTADSSDYIKIIQRLMETIRSWGCYNEEIPNDPGKMVEMLPTWLTAAGAKKKVLIVLDALNQLDGRDSGQELGWLPHRFPENVNVVISTLPGKVLSVLERRNYPRIFIEKLNDKERKNFIINYLLQYRKRLPDSAVDQLVHDSHTSNPLFLKTILGELRIMGIHEELNQKIQYYLSADSIENLYEKMLGRMEHDFDRVREHLVRDALCFIWSSRRGVSESELLDLLGNDENALPRAYLSPFLLALEDLLLVCSGLLTFAHDRLRIAVENRYLQSSETIALYRKKLYSYFKEKEVSARIVDEIPYQLTLLKNWNMLHSYIRRMEVFELGYKKDPMELLSYWFKLGDFYNMDESYRVALQSWENALDNQGLSHERVVNMTIGLGNFLCFAGLGKRAEPLFERAYNLSYKELGFMHKHTARSMELLGRLYLENGKYQEAEKYLQNALRVRKDVLGTKHSETLESMCDLGLLNLRCGNYRNAEHLYSDCYELCIKELGPNHSISLEALSGMARIHLNRREYRKAEPLEFKAFQTRARFFGEEHPDTLMSRMSYAKTLISLGRLEEGIGHYRETLRIYEKCFGPEHPGTLSSLSGLACALEENKEVVEAERLLHRVHSTQKRTLGGDHPETVNTQSDWARTLLKNNERSSAEVQYREVLYYRERILGKMHPDTMKSLYDLGRVFYLEEEYSLAEPLFRDCYERRMKALGPAHEDTLSVLTAISDVAFLLKKYDEAEEYLRRVLKYERSKKKPNRITIYRIQYKLGSVFSYRGSHSEAETMFASACAGKEDVFAKTHVEAIEARRKWGLELFYNKKYEQAMDVLITALDRAEGNADCDSLLYSEIIYDLACVYEGQGDHAVALGYYEKSLEIRKESLDENDSFYLQSLFGQANALYQLMQYAESQKCYEEALLVARKLYGATAEPVVFAQSRVGACLFKMGQNVEAQKKLLAALDIRRSDQDLPVEHWTEDLDILARILIAEGILGAAEEILNESVKLKQRLYGRDHRSLTDNYELYGILYLRQGSLLKAERTYRRLIAVRRRESGSMSVATLRCQKGLAITLIELEQYVEAIEILKKIVESYKEIFTRGTPELINCMNSLVYWLVKLGRVEEGARYIGAILRYQVDRVNPSDDLLYEPALLRAYSYYQDKKYRDAWVEYIKAREILDPMAELSIRTGQDKDSELLF